MPSISITLSQRTKTQVAVVKEGRLLLEVAAGVRGATDPRPVYPDTLFPVLDLGKCACMN
jgi:CubicO group peptidase (beta-lactamase class C family)